MGMPVNILFFPIESLCMGNINLKKHPAEKSSLRIALEDKEARDILLKFIHEEII